MPEATLKPSRRGNTERLQASFQALPLGSAKNADSATGVELEAGNDLIPEQDQFSTPLDRT